MSELGHRDRKALATRPSRKMIVFQRVDAQAQQGNLEKKSVPERDQEQDKDITEKNTRSLIEEKVFGQEKRDRQFNHFSNLARFAILCGEAVPTMTILPSSIRLIPASLPSTFRFRASGMVTPFMA
mgnify:CR=1 FL=1